ncbi:MAG: O-antigen ligase family protein [Dermatophilaceae bacterium]
MSAAIDAGVVAGLPVRTRPGTVDRGSLGTWLGLGWVMLACVATVVGGAKVMMLAFPVVSVILAVALLVLRRWNSYLVFTLIMWFTSNEVRRIVDWKTTYHAQSPVILTASLVSLVALPWALLARRRVRKETANLFTVALAVMTYAALVGIARNGPVQAAVDVFYLIGPLVTGLFVLKVIPDDVQLRRIIRNVAVWGALGLGGYGLIQFLILPAWDKAWLVGSAVSNLGNPSPGDFRTFSTLSTTGPLGQVLAALLLILVAERRIPRQFIAGAIGIVCLGTTLVRAGWIGLALGMIMLFVLGRTKILRMVAILGILLAGLIVLGGPIIERIGERASKTTSQTTEDTSLQKRIQFQTRIAPDVLSDPIGLGFGATGRATDLSSSDFTDPKYHNFDSGLFESWARYGVVGGTLLIGALANATAKAVRRARRTDLTDTCIAAAALGLTVGIVFTDTTRAVYGILLWLCLATLGRIPTPTRASRPAPEAVQQ